MNKFLKPISYLLTFFFYVNCASFLMEDKIPQEKTFTYPGTLYYEFYGWLDDGNASFANAILRKVHKLKLATNIRSSHGTISRSMSEDYRLQIIYEDSASMGLLLDQPEHPLSHRVEKKPQELGLYILNRIVSYNTFLIFPIFKKNQERIVFKTWRGSTLLYENFCSLDHLHVFGWIPLFLKPWDDTDEIQTRFADCVMVFAKSWKELHLNKNK
jgi:hypothetical protein